MQNKQFSTLADADSPKLLAELCIWIEKNIETNIGWKELTTASDLTNSELQFLFAKALQKSVVFV